MPPPGLSKKEKQSPFASTRKEAMNSTQPNIISGSRQNNLSLRANSFDESYHGNLQGSTKIAPPPGIIAPGGTSTSIDSGSVNKVKGSGKDSGGGSDRSFENNNDKKKN